MSIIENGTAGSRSLLLGNEAVARGALEAGVQVVASYPGTPSTEIAVSLARVAKRRGMHVEWSTNEKVAYEVAYGASLVGVRSLMSTKHLGMNWIADPLIVSAYTGTNAGLVVVVADDTHPHSSQNAMDSRYYAKLANIPCLEPSTPQEAKDLTVAAFDLSEKVSLPVLVRLTTRVAHTRADVSLGAISDERREPSFVKDDQRYVVIASAARKRRGWLKKQMDKCKQLAESFPWNVVHGEKADLGILTEGVTHGYAVDAVKTLGISDRILILKLALVHPLPVFFLSTFLQSVPKVLVLEENEPIVERDLKAIAHLHKLPAEILGRETGHVPREFELNPNVVADSIESILGVDPPELVAETLQISKKLGVRRTPYLCAGCPHRASYHAIGQVLKKLGGGIVLGDRGCYNQGVHPPLKALDTCICMGASIGLANGFSKAGIKEPIVAVLGDSTFFHAGIPPLINAVTNRSSFVTIVFDNGLTAMTGHQPAPSSGVNAVGEPTKLMRVEDIARAVGVEYVKVVDPLDVEEGRARVEEAINRKEPALIVFRRLCAIQERRLARVRGIKLPTYRIDLSICNMCRFCIAKIGCPAIEVEEDKMWIDRDQCSGCGLCTKICRLGAITKAG